MSADTFTPSLICRTPEERERFVDMSARMLPTQNVLLVTMSLLVVPGVILMYPLVPAIITLSSAALQAVLQRLSLRVRRPELMFAASLAVCLSGFTTAILLAGREHRGDLAFLIWPAVTAYSRIPTRAAHAFTAMTAVLMTAAQLAVHPSVALARPMQVTVPVVALIAVAVFASAIRDSDARHRREAIVDELTGLLNRNALETRIDELRAQAQLSGERVGLLVIDIDHFKAINDAHGHAKGDEVMRELAMRLAGRLRAYDSLYRIGGEEFAVLLPGAGREELSELSEQLRESVASAPVAGLPVTISVGAARSWGGEELAWDELFLRADGALYCAKAAGRDRVRMAPD